MDNKTRFEVVTRDILFSTKSIGQPQEMLALVKLVLVELVKQIWLFKMELMAAIRKTVDLLCHRCSFKNQPQGNLLTTSWMHQKQIQPLIVSPIYPYSFNKTIWAINRIKVNYRLTKTTKCIKQQHESKTLTAQTLNVVKVYLKLMRNPISYQAVMVPLIFPLVMQTSSRTLLHWSRVVSKHQAPTPRSKVAL